MRDNDLIPELFIPLTRREMAISECKSLPSINISTVELQWLQVLSEGWASPIKGFMRETEFLQVSHFNCLLTEDDSIRDNMSVPIVLSVTEDEKNKYDGSSSLALYYNNKPVAIMRQPEFFYHRKEERCSRQFGTSSPNHPYVKVSITSI